MTPVQVVGPRGVPVASVTLRVPSDVMGLFALKRRGCSQRQMPGSAAGKFDISMSSEVARAAARRIVNLDGDRVVA